MSFKEMNLNKPLQNALDEMGLTKPTTIQEKTFPVVMSGRDVLGIAQTGTGKTIAYLLPCLCQWKFVKHPNPQILILVPTRELVVQITEVINKLTAYMNIRVGGVYGGVGMQPQALMVRNGLDVIVGTPGRLLDLTLNGYLSFKAVKKLVIDEVDEMLDLGFRTQLARIFDLLPGKRQNLLFSATITPDVESIMEIFFNNPVKVEAAPTGTPLENIEQISYAVPNFNTKINLLQHILDQKQEMNKVLVFAATIDLADQLYEKMSAIYPNETQVIHSRRAQNQRFHAVESFHRGETRVLIATDVISRGMDISEVSHVINFDIPGEPEAYMHRIGRTGRADKHGTAISFFSPSEKEKLDEIQNLMKFELPIREMPSEVAISEILTNYELPAFKMKNTLTKVVAQQGSAFHEKLEKNKKTNVRIYHADVMRKKYGKPKTRGQKPRGKKK